MSTVPFQKPNSNVPIVGQPFTLMELIVPVHVTLRCNCGGDDTIVKVLNSQPAPCPSCGTVYAPAFQVNGQLQMAMGKPDAVQVPS